MEESANKTENLFPEFSKEYHNMQEYLTELISWGKTWIRIYSQYSIETSKGGKVPKIKGKLLFPEELQNLCQCSVKKEEQLQYQEKIQILLGWMAEMHKKSRQFIAEGNMISMEYLYHSFHFQEFEWYIFCMAFLREIDTQWEGIFALLQEDFQKKVPTLELCIRMFTIQEQEQYLLRQRVIQRWQFLEQFFWKDIVEKKEEDCAESIFNLPLLLDPRIVRFIYHMESEDTIFQKTVTFHLPVQMKKPLIIRQEKVELLEKMYDLSKNHGFLYLSGNHGIGKKFLVFHLCKKKKKPLLLVDTKKFFQLEYPLEYLLKRLQREVVLKGNAMLCFMDIPMENQQGERDGIYLEKILWEWKDSKIVPIFTSEYPWRESITTGERTCIELYLEELSLKERITFWETLLEEEKSCVNISQLAGAYQLPPGAIEGVFQEVMVKRLLEEDKGKLEKQLYKGCQKQLVHQLGKDAVQISTQYTMEDLILPKSQKKLLQDACNMVKYHHFVFEHWGFQEKVAYGKGVSMIFYGPPGTGKTMGAQAIANQLNLELYRVGLSSILSKYIGESEKKLGNIFEQGAKSQSILFFDEADALFGKRSEVKDSHDKYANASTAFLLQKLEEYQGVIILATNLLQNFDQAFCRRFQFIVEFPFPDEVHRTQIWQSVFPDTLPREELDFTYLGEQFLLSGSQIKSIALGAAFLAAGEGEILSMIHILKAIKRDMKKSGKHMMDSDFGVYYYLMEDTEGEV